MNVPQERGSERIARALKGSERVFALVTNTLAKDKEISDRWRGFPDVASARHLSNRVEPEVVDALVTSVTEAYPRLSHRYYAMKAKWFGKDRLDTWDRNAPLPDDDDRTITWSDARETVLSSFAGFSPRLADLAKRFFDNAWIDAPVRPGKAPGAFSHPTVPSSHPYVLLNYQGRGGRMPARPRARPRRSTIFDRRSGALLARERVARRTGRPVFGGCDLPAASSTRAPTAAHRRVWLAGKVEGHAEHRCVRPDRVLTFERASLERRRGRAHASGSARSGSSEARIPSDRAPRAGRPRLRGVLA